jgi:hypothetical protein
MMAHVHKDLIIAWANGASIQMFSTHLSKWIDIPAPFWNEAAKYRIKPIPKPDPVFYVTMGWKSGFSGSSVLSYSTDGGRAYRNLKLTFDVETGALKAAEVINNESR